MTAEPDAFLPGWGLNLSAGTVASTEVWAHFPKNKNKNIVSVPPTFLKNYGRETV